MKKLLIGIFLISTLGLPLEAKENFWQDWSDEAFNQAKKENKLVILDLQAVWCHWCHVMEETTYRNPKVNQTLKDHYVGLRVDQDSRPDISNKYQDYGWPATIIFNAEGAELAKKSGYIEPKEMDKLLNDLVKNPVPVKDEAPKPVSRENGQLTLGQKKKLKQNILNHYDAKMGAWDISHKFLDANLVEYFLFRAAQGDKKLRGYAKQTLDQELSLIDPAWGGAYQYSTGSNWHEPHFEKIMATQTDDLRIYALGYAQLQDSRYLRAAQDLERFLTEFLLSPEGTFYTSQDADVVQGEHAGDYFKLGDQARRQKGIPRIDKNTYARENGWAIQAQLALYGVTGDKTDLDRALKATQWVIAHLSLDEAKDKGGFRHGEHDKAGPFLGDTLAMGQAFLKLYMATGDRAWLNKSRDAVTFIAKKFKNLDDAPGFITSISNSRIIKSEADGDENIQVGRLANLLTHYTGEITWRPIAEKALTFASEPDNAENFYLTPTLLLLDDEFSRPPVHMTIVGHKDDPQARALVVGALRYPAAYKRLDWWDKREGPLPHADVTYPELKQAAAFACAENRCSLPAFTPEDLVRRVNQLKDLIY